MTADGQVAKSAGWHALERARPVMLALADERGPGATGPKSADTGKTDPKSAPRPAWNKEFELVVNFEINRPEAETGRYRRPYVAVWVEDGEWCARCARSPSGSRWAGPDRFNGSPT